MFSEAGRTCLFTILLLLSVVSSQETVDDCIPQEFHTSLGEYYSTPVNVILPNISDIAQSSNVLYIVYRTRTECPNTSIQFTKADSTNITLPPAYLTNFKAKLYDYNATFHVVQVTQDLVQLGQFYTYQGMVNGTLVGSPITCFIPLRDSASPAIPMTHIIFGDYDVSNVSTGSLALLATELRNRSIQKLPTSMIVTGDIAYHLEDQNGLKGDAFMKAMEPMFSSWPMMNVPGNHENRENYANYIARFRMPYHNQTSNHFFSFNMGFIHFVGINTDRIYWEPEFAKTLEEYLRNDLKYADSEEQRAKRPWILVYTHRPFYTASSSESRVEVLYNMLYQTIETILYTYNVDIFITGHVHAYQRTMPIYQNVSMGWNSGTVNNIVDAKGPIQIVEGIMGTETGSLNIDSYLKRNYNVIADNRTGYGLLTSPTNKMMLQYQHKIVNGSIIDSFYLSKTTPRPFHATFEEHEQMSPWLVVFIVSMVGVCLFLIYHLGKYHSRQKSTEDFTTVELKQISTPRELNELESPIQIKETKS